MINPVAKYDELMQCNLSAGERLDPCIVALNFAQRYINQAKDKIRHAAEDLTEEELQTICDATEVVLNAVENLVFLGKSEIPNPVWPVKWGDE